MNMRFFKGIFRSGLIFKKIVSLQIRLILDGNNQTQFNKYINSYQ